MYEWRETYAVLERALALVYGADDPARVGALRARLDNLKRVDVLGSQPGKGQRHEYDFEQISKLLVACELCEFGIPPATIAKMFEAQWPALRTHIAKAADHEMTFTVQPSFLSASWRAKGKLPALGCVPTKEARDGFFRWLHSERPGGMLGSRPRACVFSMSGLLHSFDAALPKAKAPQPPEPKGLAKRILEAGRKRRGEKAYRGGRGK